MLCRDLDNISFNTAEGSRNVGHVSTSKNRTGDDRTVSCTSSADYLNRPDERELGAPVLPLLGASTQESEAQGRTELPGERQSSIRMVTYRDTSVTFW